MLFVPSARSRAALFRRVLELNVPALLSRLNPAVALKGRRQFMDYQFMDYQCAYLYTFTWPYQ